QSPRGLRHRVDAREVGKCFMVAEGYRAPLSHSLVEHPQLPAADAREDVAHSIIVSELAMLVSEAWVPRLLRPESGFIDPRSVPRDEHASARRRNDLVAVE